MDDLAARRWRRRRKTRVVSKKRLSASPIVMTIRRRTAADSRPDKPWMKFTGQQVNTYGPSTPIGSYVQFRDRRGATRGEALWHGPCPLGRFPTSSSTLAMSATTSPLRMSGAPARTHHRT